MGVLLPRFISLLVIIAAAAGAAGRHAAAAAGAEEAMPVRPVAAVVGKVVVQVQQDAGTTLCCSNMTGYHECVEACFDYYPREQAGQICDPGCQEAYQCLTVSVDECPSGHPSSSSDDRLTNSGSAGGEVQLAADGTLCCTNMTLFHECVEDCFAYYPREQAVEICDPGCKEAYQCHTVSGDECPSSGHRRSTGLLTTTTHSAERAGNAADHCLVGCKSSVCSKMVTGSGSKGVLKLHALQRCNKACYKFCTKSGGRLRTGTSSTA